MVALGVEEVVDPARVIIDAHHHLYLRPGLRYLTDEFLADLSSSHDVRATVYVQARHGYQADAAPAMQPVGETHFARQMAGIADGCDGARFGVAAAIVPFADLTLGDAVAPVLEAHRLAGGEHVKGIRHILAWHADPGLLNAAYPTTEDMMESPDFCAGFGHLAPLGFSFDAWVLFPQLSRLARLAERFFDTSIVVNHCGGPILGGPYAGRTQEVFSHWRKGMAALARCPNVMVKLSGLGMTSVGLGLDTASNPAASTALAQAWRPWMESCIELFGADRCMFASNFPADRPSYSYRTGWNAFKHLAESASDAQKSDLFSGSAARFYRLPPILQDPGRDT